MESSSIILDTSEQIAAYRMLSVYHALKLEAKTGLRHSRGSVLQVAQTRYGVKSRTKKGAVDEMHTKLVEAGIIK